MSEYLVVNDHEGVSWGAYCPDLPGVGVVGDTQDEMERLIREAITFPSKAFEMQASRSRSRPRWGPRSSKSRLPDDPHPQARTPSSS